MPSQTSDATPAADLEGASRDADRMGSDDLDCATVSCGPEKTYLALRLVDEDGNPLDGQSYRVRLPDGSSAEGMLDDSGELWVKDIDAGQCSVAFPDLEKRVWPAAAAV